MDSTVRGAAGASVPDIFSEGPETLVETSCGVVNVYSLKVVVPSTINSLVPSGVTLWQ